MNHMHLSIGAGLLWVAVILNWVAVAFTFILAWYRWRLVRRWYALDELLAHLCAVAFINQHKPIWKAWAEVMGDFNVTVHHRRRYPESISIINEHDYKHNQHQPETAAKIARAIKPGGVAIITPATEQQQKDQQQQQQRHRWFSPFRR